MEMEHINENTIKVVIANSDLEARGISFFDLLGNQKKVETFFYSILEEVDVRHEFEGIDSVTFQVVPKGDSLELYITKGLALDSKLQPKLESISLEDLDLDPLEQVIQYLKSEIQDKQQVTEKPKQKAKAQPAHYVFVFFDFDDFTELAQQLPTTIANNRLFFYKDHYYWAFDAAGTEDIKRIRVLAREFAEQTRVSLAVLEEHGETIMPDNAIATAQKYFK